MENFASGIRTGRATKWIPLVILISLILLYKYSHLGVRSSLTATTNMSQMQAEENIALKFESGDNITDCSNKIVSSADQLQIHLNKTNPKRSLCTADLLRDYYSRSNHFYSDGVWHLAKEPEEAQFYPDLCQFDSSAANFNSCRRKNIRRILLTGDSNGWHYLNGLLAYFRQHRWTCTINCSMTDGKNYTLYLEYIGMIHFIDSSLRLTYEMTGHFDVRLFSADTFVEYLLKYYLPYHGMPDLWIMHSPIHHEAWGSSLSKFEADLLYFMRILKLYWPSKSQLVILPDFRECPKKQQPDLLYITKEHLNMTKNEKIHSMNQVLFRVVREFVAAPGGNIHGFLDLGKITCPVMCSWHEDGGHMQPFWYKKMLQYVFQLLCLS